jgi:hypothetical protein
VVSRARVISRRVRRRFEGRDMGQFRLQTRDAQLGTAVGDHERHEAGDGGRIGAAAQRDNETARPALAEVIEERQRPRRANSSSLMRGDDSQAAGCGCWTTGSAAGQAEIHADAAAVAGEIGWSSPAWPAAGG